MCKHLNCTILEFNVIATQRDVVNGVAGLSSDEPYGKKRSFEIECKDCGMFKRYGSIHSLPKWARTYYKESVKKDDQIYEEVDEWRREQPTAKFHGTPF